MYLAFRQSRRSSVDYAGVSMTQLQINIKVEANMDNSSGSVRYSYTNSSGGQINNSVRISGERQRLFSLQSISRITVKQADYEGTQNFMGNNIEMMCLFQSAQIQRLSEIVKEYELKLRGVEGIGLDRGSYETQIHELTQYITNVQEKESLTHNRRYNELKQLYQQEREEHMQTKNKYSRSIQHLNNVDIQNENLRAEISKLQRQIYQINIQKQNLQSSKVMEMSKIKYEIESSKYDEAHVKLQEIRRLKDSNIVLKKQKEQYQSKIKEMHILQAKLNKVQEINMEYENKIALFSQEIQRLSKLHKEKSQENSRLREFNTEYEHKTQQLGMQIKEIRELLLETQASYAHKIQELIRENQRKSASERQLQIKLQSQFHTHQIKERHQIQQLKTIIQGKQHQFINREIALKKQHNHSLQHIHKEYIHKLQFKEQEHALQYERMNNSIKQLSKRHQKQIQRMNYERQQMLNNNHNHHSQQLNHIQQLKTQNDALNSKLYELSQRENSINAQLTTLQQRIPIYNNNINTLQQQLHIQQQQSHTLSQQSTQYQNIINQQQHTINHQQEQIKGKEHTQIQLRQQIKHKQTQISQLLSQKQHHINKYESIVFELESTIKSNSMDNSVHIDNIHKEVQYVKESKLKLQQELQELCINYNHANHNIHSLQQQINSMKALFQREVQQSGSQIQAKNKRIFQYQSELINLQHKYQSTIHQLETNIINIKQELSAKDNQLSMKETQILNINKMHSNKQQQLTHLKQEYHNIQHRLTHIQQQLNQYQQGNATLQTTLNERHSSVQQLQCKIQQKQSSYQQNITQLQQQHQTTMRIKLQQTQAKYRQQLDRGQRQYRSQLDRRQRQYRQQLDRRQRQQRVMREQAVQNQRKWDRLLDKIQNSDKQHEYIICKLQYIIEQQHKQYNELSSINQIKQLLTQLKTQTNHILQHQTQIKHTLQHNHQQLNNNINHHTMVIEKENVIMGLKEEVMKYSHKLQQLQRENQEHANLNNKYKQEINHKTQQLNNYAQQILKENGKLQEIISKQEAMVKKLRAQLDRNNIQVQQMRKQYQQMCICNDEANRGCREMKKQLQIKSKEVHELSSMVIVLKNENKLGQSSNKTVGGNSGNRQRIQEYENKVSLISQQVQRLQSIISLRNSQIKEYKQQLQYKQLHYSKLQSSIKEYQSYIFQLQTRVNSNHNNQQQYREEIIKLKQQNKGFIVSIQEMKNKIHGYSNLQAQIQSLTHKLSTYDYHQQPQHQQLKSTIHSLTTKEAQLNNIIHKLKQDNISLKNNNYSLSLQIKKAQYTQQKLNILNTQIDRLTNANTDLQHQVKQCRIFIGEDSVIQRRYRQSLTIIVMQSAQIQSLRALLKNSQHQVSEIRKNRLSPFK